MQKEGKYAWCSVQVLNLQKKIRLSRVYLFVFVSPFETISFCKQSIKENQSSKLSFFLTRNICTKYGFGPQ